MLTDSRKELPSSVDWRIGSREASSSGLAYSISADGPAHLLTWAGRGIFGPRSCIAVGVPPRNSLKALSSSFMAPQTSSWSTWADGTASGRAKTLSISLSLFSSLVEAW